MEYGFIKSSSVIIMLGVSCVVSAVGLPIIDPGAPIKISKSAIYSCNRGLKPNRTKTYAKYIY